MILSRLTAYLAERKRAVLIDISHHLGADPETLRMMLTLLERKGRVRKLPGGTLCPGGCNRCDPIKDMLKEALAIWENRVGAWAKTSDPEHVALLLRMGRVESVLDLSASGNAIPPPHQDQVRSSPPRISPVWI